MKRIRRILILGYFGFITNQLDGQTVKTRDVLRLYNLEYPNITIEYYDTQEFKFNKLSIILMFRKVCGCNELIYLPANNNLKYIFPILFGISKIFRFSIQYYVVGGWLSSYIRSLPVHRWMLKRIKAIHCETKRLEQDLKNDYGFKNVDIIPNFRFFDFTPTIVQSEDLRVVFMARIMKEKGLDWIFTLAEYLKNHQLSNRISITFYGQINDKDKEYFYNNVAQYEFVKYEHALQPEEIYETLSKYDCLILPTHFYTEGLPGSIVDAYISGIPVIATDWINAREFIDDGQTGFIIPFENGESKMIEKILYLSHNPQDVIRMKKNCLAKRQEFAPPQLPI